MNTQKITYDQLFAVALCQFGVVDEVDLALLCKYLEREGFSIFRDENSLTSMKGFYTKDKDTYVVREGLMSALGCTDVFNQLKEGAGDTANKQVEAVDGNLMVLEKNFTYKPLTNTASLSYLQPW